MQNASPLSYRVVPPIAPEHRIARWIAKVLALTCALMAVFTILHSYGRSSLENLGLAPVTVGWEGVRRSTVVGSLAVWQMAAMGFEGLLFTSSLLVVIFSVGLMARGKSHRKYLIAALVFYCFSRLGKDSLPYLSYWLDYARWQRVVRVSINLPYLLPIIGGTLSVVVPILLPAVCITILSRRWVSEALSVCEQQVGNAGMRITGTIACLSGLFGLLIPFAGRMGFDLPHYLDLRANRSPEFTPFWIVPSMMLLFFLSISSLIGGFLLLRHRACAIPMLVWQARLSVVINTVNLLVATILTVNYTQSGTAPEISAGIALRLVALTTDALIWIYVGSEAAGRMLRDPAGSTPLAVLPVADAV